MPLGRESFLQGRRRLRCHQSGWYRRRQPDPEQLEEHLKNVTHN